MTNKKKGKRPKRRITDTAGKIDEAPGTAIEPGGAIDEAEAVEERPKAKKEARAPEPDKKVGKTARKPQPRGPSLYAKLKKFLKDVHAEAKKVVWPDSEQLKNSTIVVVTTIVALAAFMGFFSNIFFKISDRVFLPETTITAPAEPAGPGADVTPGEGEEGGGGGGTDGGVPADAEGTS